MGGSSSTSPSVKDVQSNKSNEQTPASSRRNSGSYSETLLSVFKGTKKSDMSEEVSSFYSQFSSCKCVMLTINLFFSVGISFLPNIPSRNFVDIFILCITLSHRKIHWQQMKMNLPKPHGMLFWKTIHLLILLVKPSWPIHKKKQKNHHLLVLFLRNHCNHVKNGLRHFFMNVYLMFIRMPKHSSPIRRRKENFWLLCFLLFLRRLIIHVLIRRN